MNDGLSGALGMAVRRFRLLEAHGLATFVAVDYPAAVDYADLLDGYHHFVMAQHPKGLEERRPTPFSLAIESERWVEEEKRRLAGCWTDGWSNRPLENLFALAYWSVAQYDGLRAAVWLLEVFRRLPDTSGLDEVESSLRSIVHVYSGETTSGGSTVDLYVALQLASDRASGGSGDESLIDAVDRYRPRPFW